MCLQRLKQQNEKVTASSDKMAKAVFKVNAAHGLKARGRLSNKESMVTFNDLGKEFPSTTSRRDSEAGVSVQTEGP